MNNRVLVRLILAELLAELIKTLAAMVYITLQEGRSWDEFHSRAAPIRRLAEEINGILEGKS
jgi:hypothetical protein